MAKIKYGDVKIVSRGFSLHKAKESTEGRSITLDDVQQETGLSRGTVLRFIGQQERGTDVGGSSLAAAQTIAAYYGVVLNELLDVAEKTGAEKESGGKL